MVRLSAGGSLRAGLVSRKRRRALVESDGATYDKRGSYIIAPEATRLLCVYGGDGATRGKTCRPPGSSTA